MSINSYRMPEITKSDPISGTFCPACSEIVFHAPEVIPLEMYCPSCDKLVEVPQQPLNAGKWYVRKAAEGEYSLLVNGESVNITSSGSKP